MRRLTSRGSSVGASAAAAAPTQPEHAPTSGGAAAEVAGGGAAALAPGTLAAFGAALDTATAGPESVSNRSGAGTGAKPAVRLPAHNGSFASDWEPLCSGSSKQRVVQGVVNRREFGGLWKCKVRYVGCSKSDDEWVRQDAVAPAHIDEFCKRKRAKEGAASGHQGERARERNVSHTVGDATSAVGSGAVPAQSGLSAAEKQEVIALASALDERRPPVRPAPSAIAARLRRLRPRAVKSLPCRSLFLISRIIYNVLVLEDDLI